MKKLCLWCEKAFVTRSRKRKFCTHACYALSRRGIARNLDLRGSKNPNWRGGRRIDKDGYVIIHTPHHPFCESDGYVREHRLVMEKALKRFLVPSEIVHHLNGNRSDNRLENLQLMTKTDHDAIHLAEGWAHHKEQARLRRIGMDDVCQKCGVSIYRRTPSSPRLFCSKKCANGRPRPRHPKMKQT